MNDNSAPQKEKVNMGEVLLGGSAGPLDHNVPIGSGFGVPYTKQMFFRSPGNPQRGYLLVPWGDKIFFLVFNVAPYTSLLIANNG